MDRLTKLTRRRVPFSGEYYDRLHYETDGVGGFRLIPNQRLPHITINEWGYRGRSYNGGETHLLLGDSVTFGIGAENDDMIFSRVFEKTVGLTIADASIRAYRVGQHLSRLPELLHRLPRIEGVILWGGFADLLYWVTSGGKTEGAFQFNETYARRPAWENKLRSWFSPKRVNTFLRIQKKTPLIDPLQKLVRVVADAVLAIEALCAQRNLEFLFLLQPFVRHSRSTDPELAEIARECDKKTMSKCGVSWSTVAGDFVFQLQAQLAGHLRSEVMDCQPFVEDRDFLDQVHLRSSSLEKIAENIASSEIWKNFQNSSKDKGVS